MVTTIIVFEAVTRLANPEPVRAGIVVVVALIITVVNLAAAFVLYEKRVDLNMRSALLHIGGRRQPLSGIWHFRSPGWRARVALRGGRGGASRGVRGWRTAVIGPVPVTR